MKKLWVIYSMFNGYPSIYAITDKKELKEMFESMRDMSHFIIDKHEYETETDRYMVIASNHFKNLVKRRFTINDEDVYIAITEEEEERVFTAAYDEAISEFAKYTNSEEVEFFRPEILKALDYFRYFEVDKIKNNIEGYLNPFLEGVQTSDVFRGLQIDQSYILFLLYGSTFKKS